MASIKAPSHIREAAGILCVTALRLIRILPPTFVVTALRPLLQCYPLLRPAHARRLRACFAAAPFPIAIGAYYRCRLRLLAHALRGHGRNRHPVRQEGLAHYRKALASGRPVALLGLHAGPFEMLHGIPEAPPGRPFRILTAPAFSGTLTDFMVRGREAQGKSVLLVGGEGTRGLERGLRETADAKGVLAFMVDQHPGKQEGVATLELWDRISVPWPQRLLEFLAARDFIFVPISARSDDDGSALVRYHPPLTGPGGPDIQAFLEEAIAAAPEQWNWSYPKVSPVTARSPGRAVAASPGLESRA